MNGRGKQLASCRLANGQARLRGMSEFGGVLTAVGLWALAICGGPFSGATWASGPDDRPPNGKPTAHERREIEGWSVQVDGRLLAAPQVDLGQRALRLLADRLYEIALITPAEQLERLRAVPIWLDLSHGELQSMQYHPDAGWLKSHGYSEELARCVHIPRAELFASPRHHRQQPWAVLHELAHAYHDRELTFEEPRIKLAWQRTVDAGKWKEVLHIDGGQRRHYALTNQMEFFAELSESYFGLNDFYPFQRAELQRDEPELHALLVEIWGKLP